MPESSGSSSRKDVKSQPRQHLHLEISQLFVVSSSNDSQLSKQTLRKMHLLATYICLDAPYVASRKAETSSSSSSSTLPVITLFLTESSDSHRQAIKKTLTEKMFHTTKNQRKKHSIFHRSFATNAMTINHETRQSCQLIGFPWKQSWLQINKWYIPTQSKRASKHAFPDSQQKTKHHCFKPPSQINSQR
jgi:hypothetical protein